MSWSLLALLTALFESGKDVCGKLALREADALQVTLAWRLYALPVLLPVAWWSGIPSLGSDFWPALLISAGLNLVSGLLYVRALQLSDLSLTVPLVNLTPALLLVTSPLILGEAPSPTGALGVLLVVIGTLMLHRDRGRPGWMGPFRALAGNRGARLMLLVALIWSVSANVDKLGLQNSSPLFWALAVNSAITLGLLPLQWLRQPRRLLPVFPGTALLATGFCGGLTLLCQMTAISLTQVPYVIAIKRTSTLVSVLWGSFLFGESGLRQRLPAAVLMLGGVLMITLT